MGIIGISGKINSGKDTVGEMVQIISASPHFTDEAVVSFIGKPKLNPLWEIRRFADKLKDMVCMLLGCTREQLEDREFKEKELGEEWHKYQHENGQWYCTIEYYNSLTKNRQAYWSLIKLTPRLLLQLLGTECGRQIIHPNIWCNSLMSEYKPTGEFNTIHDSTIYPDWIITDTRFENELKAVKDKGGITIRVNRPCNICGGSGYHKMSCPVSKSGEHCSETALDNAEFDYVIENDGELVDLVSKVREIMLKENLWQEKQ